MRSPVAFVLVLVLCVVGIGAVAQGENQSQSESPVFRSVADVIQVDVSVLDGRRLPVTGLVAGDFTVLENGRERAVEVFNAIDLPERATAPTGASWMRTVPSDVATNRAGTDEGRIVVILMDRSIPFGGPTLTARKVAAAAVNALGPGDLAALVMTSGGVPENLTSDRERLLRAINQRDWSTDISDEAKAVEAGVGLSPEIFNKLTDGRCLCGLCVMDTVTNVALSLEAMPRRRKSVLFIGASMIFQAGPQIAQVDINCGQKLDDARKVMWTALDRSGVTVHSIDPTGLVNPSPAAQTSSPLRAGAVRGALNTAVQRHLEDQGSLGVLPGRTGGRVVVNTNGPEESVPAIVRESDSYYVLGFRPSEPLVPGQSRTIEVKVNRRDVKVHARRQFTVPPPPSPATSAEMTKASLGEALRSPLPVADRGLAMNASAFAVPGSARGAVAVTIDLSSFADDFARSPGRGGQVSVAVGAYDTQGRPIAATEGTVTLPGHDAATGDRGLVESIARLDLPPGDHELRAAVSVPGTGRTASVFSRVAVPPFASAPLTLSHITMTATAATVSVPPDALDGVVPVVPTTQRTFARGSRASAFMRIYQGVDRAEAIEPVVVTATIVDAAGASRIRQALEFKAAEFGVGRAADCRLALPMAGLPAGEYLLTVEAARGERVAGRAVRFTVR